MPSLLASFKRQQLLLEFAVIKSKCPDGIYLAPEASNPAIWSGVYFVREGPYASAVLRFEISFPAAYPEVGPLLTFNTEIFHPLLVPLTTYTFAAGALGPNTTVSSSETERLPPGSFNLQDGFSAWYARPTSRDGNFTEPLSVEKVFAENKNSQPTLEDILQYVKKAFESAEFLDELPLSAAVNTNAWHAWRNHRGLPKLGSRSISPASVESGRVPLSPARNPGDWNWDGVWESRIRNGTEETVSDALLFGSKTNRPVNPTSSSIRFSKNDDEKTKEIQESMLRAMGIEPT